MENRSGASLAYLSRGHMILGGLVLLAVVATAFIYCAAAGGAAGAASRVEPLADVRAESEVGGEGTPEYNGLVDAQNAERAAEARASGGSYVDVPTGGKAPAAAPGPGPLRRAPAGGAAPRRDPAGAPAAGPDPGPRMNARPLAPAVPPREAGRGRGGPAPDDRALAADLKALHESLARRGAPEVTLAAPPERQRAAGEAPPATPAAPGLPAGLGPGSVLYAVTDLALDSDLPSPVVATVAEGPLKGAKALGSFRLSGEGLAIAFTRIVPPGGPEIRVEAVGIDPDASRPSVRASVDTHFWERWGSLAAASFIEGLGRAAEGRRTRVYVSGDAVVEDGAGKTARDLALEAAGKVGERAAVQVERGFDRPPTVTVRAGEHVGILLLSVG